MWKSINKFSNQKLSIFAASVVLLGSFILFMPVMLFSIRQVVSQGETRYSQQEVNRAENILLNETNRLDQTLLDWSSWDDTYQFALDQNQAYIDDYLADSAISNLGIDVFLTLNTANEVVYVKYVDRESQVEAPLPFEVDAVFQAYPTILIHDGEDPVHKGIGLISDHPVIIASRPILDSQSRGPAQGTLVFIRLLDQLKLDEFSQLSLRKIDVYAAAARQPSQSEALPAPDVLRDQVFVQPGSQQIVNGYKYLADLNGQPLLVLKVENTRDLYLQGWTTAIVFSVTLLIMGVLLFGGSFLFTRSFLQSRQASRKYLEQFQVVVNQSTDAILLIDPHFEILEANPASHQLLAWQPDKNQNTSLKSLLVFEPVLDEDLISSLRQSGKVAELHCTRHDGLPLDLELSISQISNAEIQAFSLILHDITAHKQAENALRASEERYMLSARGANDGLWDWNLMTDELYYSPRWINMLGYSEAEIKPVPKEWFDRIHPDDLLLVKTQLSDHLRNRTEHFECEYRILHQGGYYRWMLARGVAVWDPAGYAHRIAGSQTDISNRKKIEDQLRYDALHDTLTGLGNRTLLIDHLNHVNERKKRKPDLLFALFFLDFDRFKQINDSLGHMAGDQLLIEASQRLEVGLRSTDTVSRFSGPRTLARIAGDEFVILLEDFSSIEDIYKVAERVTKLLSDRFFVAGKEVNLTASIGLVIPEEPYGDVDDIIRDADIAMYRAKQLGGGKVTRFSRDMYQGAIVRMQLESDLRQAVERNEFEVYYQPIYILDNDDIAGFEALVRWNHPERGLLLPAEFIHTAEETGLIVPIGYFVLEDACRRMQSWREIYHIAPELMVSVNLSSRQIMIVDLVVNIRAILEKTGFDPKRLWLEVTETTLLENNEMVLAHLTELRAMGIRIEIDDFGTGYSSLSYLQNLPVDGFKIDQSFIKDIHGGGSQIVKTLVDLGHSMGLTEVAEGVETDHQMEYLKKVSCDYAQGYLMARPVNASGIEELLKKMKVKEKSL